MEMLIDVQMVDNVMYAHCQHLDLVIGNMSDLGMWKETSMIAIHFAYKVKSIVYEFDTFDLVLALMWVHFLVHFHYLYDMDYIVGSFVSLVMVFLNYSSVGLNQDWVRLIVVIFDVGLAVFVRNYRNY
jgi:hypothetical protein